MKGKELLGDIAKDKEREQVKRAKKIIREAEEEIEDCKEQIESKQERLVRLKNKYSELLDTPIKDFEKTQPKGTIFYPHFGCASTSDDEDDDE